MGESKTASSYKLGGPTVALSNSGASATTTTDPGLAGQERSFMSHNKTTRVLALVIAMAAALGFLSGCNSDNKSGSSDTIKIGLIADLSGATADLGKGDELAAKLAVTAINAAGGVNGKKIELKVYDDQGDPAKTTNAATRLAYNDKVVMMICSYSSAAAGAAATVAGQAKIPIVSSGQLDALTDPSQPWVALPLDARIVGDRQLPGAVRRGSGVQAGSRLALLA
jgi:ABC-type branched-subunit amino acid transport system substrate-binding protein